MVLLGDEAVARAAIDAGVSAAYAYPGTPATEILEYVLRHSGRFGRPHAAWCANEKTAYEEALGVSMVGRRALVCMKHVGLNVAADPFINSAIVAIGGGLVVAVADDPSMHSSQNEQDSRFYADFARVMCLEPADQQQAYDMTREAFDISERFGIPVVVRLVTRLAHSRAVVRAAEARSENALAKPAARDSWVLLPSNARRLWKRLLEVQPQMRELSESSDHNRLDLRGKSGGAGVITAGIARTYFEESVSELDPRPSHLHVGTYPAPADKIRQLARHVRRILVLEDGYPFLERQLLGILAPALEIHGRMSGHLPAAGELDPDIVRRALSLPRSEGASLPHPRLPARPPQLCAGCPHGDSFAALAKALSGYEHALVTSDIGCYTLGALPPYSAIESCVCMGASIGMAKGAAEAGLFPVVAVIGDSTFLHSGVTPLMDVVAAGADVTVLILDNEVVAMTGAQPTLLPTGRFGAMAQALGVAPEHVHVIEAHPRRVDDMAAVLRREIEHHGPSVVVATRECIEAAKRRKAAAR